MTRTGFYSNENDQRDDYRVYFIVCVCVFRFAFEIIFTSKGYSRMSSLDCTKTCEQSMSNVVNQWMMRRHTRKTMNNNTLRHVNRICRHRV
jgi:hypothetical protein